jgi:hypothetical protein
MTQTTLTPLPAGTRLASLLQYENPHDSEDHAIYRLVRIIRTNRILLVSKTGVVKHISQHWAKQQLLLLGKGELT